MDSASFTPCLAIRVVVDYGCPSTGVVFYGFQEEAYLNRSAVVWNDESRILMAAFVWFDLDVQISLCDLLLNVSQKFAAARFLFSRSVRLRDSIHQGSRQHLRVCRGLYIW